MTCTLHTSQYRPGSNETKYYLAGKTNQHWGNKITLLLYPTEV